MLTQLWCSYGVTITLVTLLVSCVSYVFINRMVDWHSYSDGVFHSTTTTILFVHIRQCLCITHWSENIYLQSLYTDHLQADSRGFHSDIQIAPKQMTQPCQSSRPAGVSHLVLRNLFIAEHETGFYSFRILQLPFLSWLSSVKRFYSLLWEIWT